MDDEWDLHALVRSCSSATSAAAAATVNATTVEDYDDGSYNLESLASGNAELRNSFIYHPAAFGNVSGGLEDVYASGCGQPQSTAAATASAAVDLDGDQAYIIDHDKLPMLTDDDSHSFSMNSQSTRPRKRKNQQEKTVFKLTEEELGNDLWAWRKYGQKHIKGSPFPRNYYRCSTTKACDAKKQVEQSCMDSRIYIVSYSGEHIHPRPAHRSCLAGSTRSNKFNTTTAATDIIINTKLPPAPAARLFGNMSTTSAAHHECSISSSPAASANTSFSPTTSTSFKEINECEITDEEDAGLPR